jgi:hypothetical protein
LRSWRLGGLIVVALKNIHYRGGNFMADQYRTEKDSLGEVQVPAEAYYGAQTQRAINNFHISGLRPWRAFI